MASRLIWYLLIPCGPSRLAYAAAPAAELFRDGRIAIDGSVCRRSRGPCCADQPLLVHAVQERGHAGALHRLVGAEGHRAVGLVPAGQDALRDEPPDLLGMRRVLVHVGKRRALLGRGLEGGAARQAVEEGRHVAAGHLGIGAELVPAVIQHLWHRHCRSRFFGCTSLDTQHGFPFTSIGKEAFRHTALTTIQIDYAATIGDGAFKDIPTLKSIGMIKGLESAGVGAIDPNVLLISANYNSELYTFTERNGNGYIFGSMSEWNTNPRGFD